MDLSNISDEVLLRASKVKLLLMDCDGVLTNGDLYFNDNGESFKVFNVKDGQGISLWHKAGFQCGIITGRTSAALERRVNELGIRYLRQGSKDKIVDFKEILDVEELEADQVSYIGDDFPDIELLKTVGFAVAVNDTHESLLPYIHYKTRAKGGVGAVRECIDLILMTKSS